MNNVLYAGIRINICWYIYELFTNRNIQWKNFVINKNDIPLILAKFTKLSKSTNHAKNMKYSVYIDDIYLVIFNGNYDFNVLKIWLMEKIFEMQKTYNEKLAISIGKRLHTPISNVINILENSDSPESKKALDYTYEVLRVVNNFIELSTIENSIIDLENTSVSLNEFLILFCKSHNISNLKMPENISKYYIFDKKKVENILENMINNSIEANATKIIMEVFVEQLDKKSCQIEINIIDNGTGIPNNALNSFWINPIYTDNYRGLGLAISQKLASIMNGSIEISNESKENSIISFKFIANTETSDYNTEENLEKIKKVKILFVRDNAEYNEKIMKSLTRISANFTEINNDIYSIDQCIISNYQLMIMHSSPNLEKIYNHIVRKFNNTLPKLIVVSKTPISIPIYARIKEPIDEVDFIKTILSTIGFEDNFPTVLIVSLRYKNIQKLTKKTIINTNIESLIELFKIYPDKYKYVILDISTIKNSQQLINYIDINTTIIIVTEDVFPIHLENIKIISSFQQLDQIIK